MPLSSPLALATLAAIMVGSLVLVHVLQERQERNLIRLYRLAALDRRRASISKVMRNLRELDDNPEVIRVLGQALKNDLSRIQKLDPARGNGDQELRAANPGGGTGETGKTDKGATGDGKRTKLDQKTSLNSERDVIRARAHITDALALIRHLYEVRQIRGEQLDSTARHLALLSALVGVNSNINMAEIAHANGDSVKALSLFRAAESYLLNGPLKGAEGAQKLQLIQTRKDQIMSSMRGSGANQEFYADRAA